MRSALFMFGLLFAFAAPAFAAETYPVQRITNIHRLDFRPGAPAAGFESRPTLHAGDLFSIDLLEGNYRVTLTLGDPRRASVTTVKAESRRLMLEAVRVPRGRTERRSFIVNIRNASLVPPPENAPGGSSVRLKSREQGSFTWDDRLTLEFLGTPAIATIEIEPASVPTVFLTGDSTVTDQRMEDYASWGQMLPRMLGDRVAIANHAESGETLKSFLAELRLEKVLRTMKRGDYLFIQFGHNDQKVQWPQTYGDPQTTYPAYLRAYIAEARRLGATPVLVTSPERRTFDAAGRIRPTLAEHVAAVKRVAAEDGVALIDLNAASRAIYEALGPERSRLAFANDGKDGTHHNNYGAYVLARAVADGIRRSSLPLAGELVRGLPAFDPAAPLPPERFALPKSGMRTDERPDGS